MSNFQHFVYCYENESRRCRWTQGVGNKQLRVLEPPWPPPLPGWSGGILLRFSIFHPAKILKSHIVALFWSVWAVYRNILLRFQNDIAQIYYSRVYLDGDCSKLLFTLLTSQDAILRDLFNPESGNGMSYVRIPVSLMSDFMARDGGGWKRF